MQKNQKTIYIILSAVVVLTIAGLIFLRDNDNDIWGGKTLPKEITRELGETQSYDQKEEEFAFLYPEDLHITEESIEGITGAKRILAESSEAGKGFEIIVLPFDETGPLTKERILQDVPDMVMNEISNFKFQISNLEGIAFDSTDESIGDTHEVWFVYKGKLYQARTYRDFGHIMKEILNTWNFR